LSRRTPSTALIAGALSLLPFTLPAGAVAPTMPVHTTSIGGLALPEYIGPLEFIGEHSGPEGARSASYSYRAVGLALEISVTDLGEGSMPDGLHAPDLLQRYEEAKRDVIASTPAPGLKAQYEKEVTLGPRSGRVAREAHFTVGRGEDAASTWLIFTAAHGLVIDARFDAAPGLGEDALLSHGEILEALGEAIPDTAAPVAAARARARAEAEAAEKVAIVWDPATPREESGIWLAYLFARAAYAVSEKGGAAPVGERDASFEEEVHGRTTAVNMFRALRHTDARVASAYFSDIDRVEAAGFLREYVWTYLRRDSWGAAPPGLDLAAFDAWRATHLKGHVPVTHGRIRFRVASSGGEQRL
jgi:hypothetical protein